MKHSDSRVKNNILFSFVTKFLTLAINIVIPRLFIVTFGSDTNGLISTLSQIFTYLALLEAGIGNATVNALYKPLGVKDYDKCSSTLSQARVYYRKIGFFYLGGVVSFSLIYPLFVSTEIDYFTVFSLIVIQGFSNWLSYYFCAVYDQLLTAVGRRYVIDNIIFIVNIFATLIRIVLIYSGMNVIVVQAFYFAVILLRIPLTHLYCKMKFKWIDFRKRSNENLLKERHAFVIHELSGTIFSNTDVFVVSIFCGLSYASVYTVYNLVFSSLTSMINTTNSGLGFVLGEKNNYEDKHYHLLYDCYSTIYSLVVFVVMTIAAILIYPFVTLYTKGANDANYMMEWLPLLFSIVNIMSGYRAIAARLITVSGHAKKTQYRSIVEMIINIVSSIVLVNYLGIYGVLIGTIIALLYRSNDIIIYANRTILKRTPLIEYKNIFVNILLFMFFYFLFSKVELQINNYVEFIYVGIFISLIVLIVFFVVSLVINKKQYSHLINIIRKRKGKNAY